MNSYYLAVNGQPTGPYTVAQLASMDVQPSSMVYNESLGNWVQASQVPELAQLFTAKKPVANEKKKNLILAAVVFVLAIGLGVLAYFLLAPKNNRAAVDDDDDEPATEMVADTLAVEGFVEEAAAADAFDPINYGCYMSGRQDASQELRIAIWGGTGYLTFTAGDKFYHRNISVEEYESGTGHLRITSFYDNGNMVGTYDGYVAGDNYSGTFTNINGIQLKFDVDIIQTLDEYPDDFDSF